MGPSNNKNGKQDKTRKPGQIKPELEKLLTVLACQELVDAADTCKVLWAKVKGHPYWPAQIMSNKAADQMMKGIHRNKEHISPVQFFGTLEIAWMRECDTVEWRQGMGAGYFHKGKTKKQFMISLQQVQIFLLRRKAPTGWWGKPPDKRVLPLTGTISNVTTRRASHVLEGEENSKSAGGSKSNTHQKPKQVGGPKGGSNAKYAKDMKGKKPVQPVAPAPARKTRNSLGGLQPTSESEPPTPSGRRTRRSLQAGTLVEPNIGDLASPVRQKCKPKPKVSDSENDDDDEEDDGDDDDDDDDDADGGEEEEEEEVEAKEEEPIEGIRTRRARQGRAEDHPAKPEDSGEKGGSGFRKTPTEEAEPPVRSMPPRARAKAAAAAAAAATAAVAVAVAVAGSSAEQQEASSTTVARAERSNSGAGAELDVSMGSNDAGQSSVADESADSDRPRKSSRALGRRNGSEEQPKSKEGSKPAAAKRPEPGDGKQRQDNQRMLADQSASGRISRNGRVIKAPRRPGSPEEVPKEAAAKEQREPPAQREAKEPAVPLPVKPIVQPKRKFPEPKAQEGSRPPMQRRRIIQMPGIPMSALQKGKSSLLGHLRTQGSGQEPHVTPFVDFSTTTSAPTASSRQHTPEATIDTAPEAGSGQRPFAQLPRHGSAPIASALDAIRRPHPPAAPPKKKSLKQKQKELPHDCHLLDEDLVHDNLPSYEAIKRNIYLSRERPKRQAKSKIQVCMCTPTRDASGTGLTGCNRDCLNAASMLTCDTRLCPCALYCNNKPFHLRQLPKLRVFHTVTRGWGVKTVDGLAKGAYICEYVGEVINWQECSKRMEDAKREGEAGAAFYMMELEPGLIIDARRKGNLARMLNSSCEPNAETRKWHDAASGETHIVICAKRKIEPGEEVTYDYQFEHYGLGDMVTKYRCLCGSASCRGTMDREPERCKDFGRRVEVWWEADGAYYRGSVRSYNPKTLKHVILYDDNEEERVNLKEVPHRWLDVTAPMQPTPPELEHLARRPEQQGQQRPGQPSSSLPHKIPKGLKGVIGRDGAAGSDLPSSWLHGKLGYKLQKCKKPPMAKHQEQGSDEGRDESSIEEDAAASLMTIFHSPPGPKASPPISTIERLPSSSLRPQSKTDNKVKQTAQPEAQPKPRPQLHSEKTGGPSAPCAAGAMAPVAVKQEQTQQPAGTPEAAQAASRPAPEPPSPAPPAQAARPTVHRPEASAPPPAPPRRDFAEQAPATQGPVTAPVPASPPVSGPAAGPGGQPGGAMPPGLMPIQAMQAWPGGPHLGSHQAAMAAFAGLPPQVQAQAQAQAQAAAAAHAQAQAQAAVLQQHLLQQQISAQVAALQQAGVPANQISAALQMGIFQNGVPNGRPPALLLPQGAVMLAQRPPFMAGPMPPSSTVTATPTTASLPIMRPSFPQPPGPTPANKPASSATGRAAVPPPSAPERQPKKAPADPKKHSAAAGGPHAQEAVAQGPQKAPQTANTSSARQPEAATTSALPGAAGEERSVPRAERTEGPRPLNTAETSTTAGVRDSSTSWKGDASLSPVGGSKPPVAASTVQAGTAAPPVPTEPLPAPPALSEMPSCGPGSAEPQRVGAQAVPVPPPVPQSRPALPPTPQQAAQAALASLAAAAATQDGAAAPSPVPLVEPMGGARPAVADAPAPGVSAAKGGIDGAVARLVQSEKLLMRQSSSASTGGVFTVGATAAAGAPAMANGNRSPALPNAAAPAKP